MLGSGWALLMETAVLSNASGRLPSRLTAYFGRFADGRNPLFRAPF
jgi:hypothetical protein